jgi:dual specificity phosphatase 12
MATASPKSDDVVCRLLVVGSSRIRLSRIFSSLAIPQANLEETRKCDINLRVEYLPCIAKFASYRNESNTNIRYLESVEYYPHDSIGVLSTISSSLLQFFDQDNDKDNDNRFPSIAGVAIGSGIEGPDDTAHIERWIKTMLSGNKDPKHPIIKTITPNTGYQSMSDELTAYKQLSSAEKEAVNRQQTMGPEKMVKFVIDFTIELIRGACKPIQLVSDEVIGDNPVEEPVRQIPHIIDPSKNRYLCRMCRTALFGENDLQDPPHEASQHQFSRRKLQHGTAVAESATDHCQSYFLQDSLHWMGDDIQNGITEGKFSCPHCSAKLGSWIWSGTQCSCGTWVVPAIQIPKSKLDVMKPTIPNVGPTTIESIQELNIA